MKENTSENSSKVYEIVTKQILNQMINGEIPWRKTWFARKGEKPAYCNYETGKSYSFINCLLLGEPGQYISYKQIQKRGGHPKKGSQSKIVIFWGEFIPKKNQEEAEKLQEEGKSIEHLKVKFPKYYRVFNVNDVEGMKEKKEKEEIQKEMVRSEDPVDIADMAVSDYRINSRVEIEEALNLEPNYNAGTDTVEIPLRSQFEFEEDWYAALFDGLIHSTATEERLDRKIEMKKIESGEMSVKEELIGEIGSSMILTACGLTRKETKQQIAAECQKWVEAMNHDYRLIVNASQAAEKAARYVLGEFAALSFSESESDKEAA